MIDYRSVEQQLRDASGLECRPVAVAFTEAPPRGVPKFIGSVPSGCTFWRMASNGRTFYTEPSDHYNCPIGSYTHHIELPPKRANELSGTLGFMESIGYIRMDEVPGIPVLHKAPRAIVYAPLGDTPVDPDVVLLWGPAARVMLLQEAATAAGVAATLNMLGRPTCMAVPASLSSGMVASCGCVGNRVYTGLGDGELYAAVPGKDVARVAQSAATIASANATLFQYHQERKRELTRSGA